MKEISPREFDFYALSLPRGHGFGDRPPVGAWRSEDGFSCGVIRRGDQDGLFGFLIMRRRLDHVFEVLDQEHHFKDFRSSFVAMGKAMRDGEPLRKVPSGVKPRPNLALPGPKGFSDIFRLLTHPARHGAAWAINQVYLALPSPDGNWASDCQTGNFHTRIWELYLLACFREQGLLVSQDTPSPDFHISNPLGLEAWIEAVTANPTTPYNHAASSPRSAPEDMNERQLGDAAVRFARTLRSKIQRGYDLLPHVIGMPFAIAIADFHSPSSMTWSREALPSYLYGQSAEILEQDGRLVGQSKTVEYLLGDNEIPAGLFRNPENSGISAIIFSNAATIAKFNRMGFLAGVRTNGLRVERQGLLFDRRPGALKGIEFDLDITEDAYRNLWPPYGEEWSVELEVFHNPLAKYPLSFELLPQASHWYEEAGEICTRAFYKSAVLSSVTKLFMGGGTDTRDQD